MPHEAQTILNTFCYVVCVELDQQGVGRPQSPGKVATCNETTQPCLILYVKKTCFWAKEKGLKPKNAKTISCATVCEKPWEQSISNMYGLLRWVYDQPDGICLWQSRCWMMLVTRGVQCRLENYDDWAVIFPDSLATVMMMDDVTLPELLRFLAVCSTPMECQPPLSCSTEIPSGSLFLE